MPAVSRSLTSAIKKFWPSIRPRFKSMSARLLDLEQKMKNFPSARLTGLLLMLCLCGSLSPARAQNMMAGDDAWGLGYLDDVLPEMLAQTQACEMPAMTRFFDVL